jgi:hypothetical protein
MQQRAGGNGRNAVFVISAAPRHRGAQYGNTPAMVRRRAKQFAFYGIQRRTNTADQLVHPDFHKSSFLYFLKFTLYNTNPQHLAGNRSSALVIRRRNPRPVPQVPFFQYHAAATYRNAGCIRTQENRALFRIPSPRGKDGHNRRG